MVRKEVLHRTIKRMHSSGISDAEIAKTLEKFGMSKEEVKKVLENVLGAEPDTDPKQKLDEKEHEKIAEKTSAKVKEELAEERETADLRETSVHTAIADYSKAFSDIEKSIKRLEVKVSARTPSGKGISAETEARLHTIEKKLNSMEKSIADISASSRASKDLLKKVLESTKASMHRKR